MERSETWADVLCLFALAEEFACTVVVCSKTFPFPEFCTRFGSGEGAQLLLAHWKGVQFRSMLPREEWNRVYEAKKAEKGVEAMDHRLYAGLLRYQDRTEEAILHCTFEVQRDPKSLVGHHTWSIVLSDNFRAEEAMQHYLSQLEIAPDHPHSYNGVGTTLHDLRRYDDAIFFYKAQLFFNPRNKYSHLNLSLAYARNKNFEEAHREHLLQLSMHPTDRNTCDYYLELLNDMKIPEQGVTFFSAWAQKEPWRNEWRFHLARAHMACKQYELAAKVLQTVLRSNPNDCRALAAMAELLERNGFYQRAAALLRRVLVVFPRHPRCRSFLGDCEVKSGNFDVARQVLQEQIAMFPNDSEAYSRMAELLAQKGDTDDAIAMYKKARLVDPADSSSLFNIGLCYLDLENFPEARAYFQRHVAENPDDPVSLLEIANTFYAQGELDMSIRGYRNVLAVKPDHHDCRAWLAATLVEAGKQLEAVAEYETLIKETGKVGFHYNISYIYLTLSERPNDDLEQQKRWLRLADIHAQLETGVRRQFIDSFFAADRNVLEMREEIQQQVSGARLNMRGALLLREENVPFGLTWTPQVHRLCSRLAKQQVFVVLLLCRRVERTIGYPFPKEIKHMIIREMLAAPSERFVRSVVPPRVAELLFDTSETVCFRPLPAGVSRADVVREAQEAGVTLVHSTLLYWSLADDSPFPLTELPADHDPAKFQTALYLTFPSMKEASRYTLIPALSALTALKVSPAEQLHVPYESCTVTKADVAPYEGAVATFCHSFRNRQMCEAAAALAGEADDMSSLNVAVSYYLGDEGGVKGAIHCLIMMAKKLSGWASYNAALVVYLLLVRLSPHPDDRSKMELDIKEDDQAVLRQRWTVHFETYSEYRSIVMSAADLLIEWRPCGEAMFHMAVMLQDLATMLPAESVHRSAVLEKAASLLRLQAVRSPKHPYVLYVLNRVREMCNASKEELLAGWEACAARNPWLGHMEAAALLMEQDRLTEAFAHLEQQVAVDPLKAYAKFAHLLFLRTKRLAPKGKELKRMLEDVKRFYDVHSHLRETLPSTEEDAVHEAWDEFVAWEAAQQLPPPPNQNRVDFVPRVEETPFGISDDFEQEFLK